MEKRTRFPVRRFFLGLLAVLVPGVTALSALQVYFERQINRKDEYLAPILHSDLSRAEVLVLGDSHANDAFAREGLPPRVHSVAHGQDSLKEDYLKARRLLREDTRLRYLVVQCDPHVVASYRLSSNNRFRTYYFADHRDINRLYRARLSPFKQRLFTAVPIVDTDNRAEAVEVLIAHAGTLLRRRTGAEPSGPAAGWPALSAEERARRAAARIERQFGPGGTAAELLVLLRDIVALAHARGVVVIGLVYPFSREYLAELASRKLDAVTADLARAGVDHFLDYSRVFSERPELFLDQDHVNTRGSSEFLSLFLRDLDRLTPGVADRAPSAGRGVAAEVDR